METESITISSASASFFADSVAGSFASSSSSSLFAVWLEGAGSAMLIGCVLITTALGLLPGWSVKTTLPSLSTLLKMVPAGGFSEDGVTVSAMASKAGPAKSRVVSNPACALRFFVSIPR